MARRRTIELIVTGALLVAAGMASASETISYTYDARGRLVSVSHAGGVNNNVTSSYNFDAADNRLNVTVSNALTGTLSSSSSANTCSLGSGSTCTLDIYWNLTGGTASSVVVKVGSPQVVFASGGLSGSSTAPWIQASGSTFYLYADGQLKTTLFVHGVP